MFRLIPSAVRKTFHADHISADIWLIVTFVPHPCLSSAHRARQQHPRIRQPLGRLLIAQQGAFFVAQNHL